jgi:hypothetical protein
LRVRWQAPENRRNVRARSLEKSESLEKVPPNRRSIDRSRPSLAPNRRENRLGLWSNVIDEDEGRDPSTTRHLSRRSTHRLSKDVRRVFRLADVRRRARRAQGQGASPITPDPSRFPSVAVAQSRPNPYRAGRTFCHPPETPVPWLSLGPLSALASRRGRKRPRRAFVLPPPRSRSLRGADPLVPAFPRPAFPPNRRKNPRRLRAAAL